MASKSINRVTSWEAKKLLTKIEETFGTRFTAPAVSQKIKDGKIVLEKPLPPMDYRRLNAVLRYLEHKGSVQKAIDTYESGYRYIEFEICNNKAVRNVG